LLGPLGVAAVNIYISGRYLAPPPWLHARARARGGELRLSARGDLLALACLWAAVLAGSASFDAGDVNRHAQLTTNKVGNAQPASTPAQTEASTSQPGSATQGPLSAERVPLQSLNRPARAEANITGAVAPPNLSAPAPAVPAPTSGENSASPPPAESTAAPAANAVTPAAATISPAKPGGTGAAELMRMVVPPNLQAHGTISGTGSATTLTIACADCTYEASAARLSAASTRATIRAAGVRVVVLINRQDSWTFML
jgi:hypothetical protein